MLVGALGAVILWLWHGIYNGFVRNRIVNSKGRIVTGTSARLRGAFFVAIGIAGLIILIVILVTGNLPLSPDVMAN
jgi:hypothetical protein